MSKLLETVDARFDKLIDPLAKLELLGKGFQFTEGPVWHTKDKCLYFSDIPADTMFRYDNRNGIAAFRNPSHFSNGLTLDKFGNIIACEHKSRSVTIQKGNEFVTVAESYQGKKLNSPNDIIISKDGTIYFTDPIYGLQEGLGGPAAQELDLQGVYKIEPGKSEPELIFDDFERPNGLAFSEDESLLFVDDTVRQHIRVFTKNNAGNYSNGVVFAELFGEGPGRPDGMKLDNFGNVFCTGPGGIWVFSVSSELLGKIHLEQKTANLAWGDDDCKSLFITSGTQLLRIKCITSGKSPC